jgi:hypothetical protein
VILALALLAVPTVLLAGIIGYAFLRDRWKGERVEASHDPPDSWEEPVPVWLRIMTALRLLRGHAVMSQVSIHSHGELFIWPLGDPNLHVAHTLTHSTVGEPRIGAEPGCVKFERRRAKSPWN